MSIHLFLQLTEVRHRFCFPLFSQVFWFYDVIIRIPVWQCMAGRTQFLLLLLKEKTFQGKIVIVNFMRLVLSNVTWKWGLWNVLTRRTQISLHSCISHTSTTYGFLWNLKRARQTRNRFCYFSMHGSYTTKTSPVLPYATSCGILHNLDWLLRFRVCRSG